MKTNTGLVEYALAQVGKPYWYGTYGSGASKSYYNAKKRQYPSYYKWAYDAALEGVKVHDCIGLIKGYLWCDSPTDNKPAYNKSQDMSASGMRRKCKVKGKIAAMPDVPGLLVFSPGHIGVYVGGGYVVDARGHSAGVVKKPISNHKWEEWGVCPLITYDRAIESGSTATEKENSTGGSGKVNITFNVLQKGSKGRQVKALQQLLMANGCDLPQYGADGSYGNETVAAVKKYQAANNLTVDGSAGKQTLSHIYGA